MTDGTYVYILPDHLPPTNVEQPWEDNDVYDEPARLAFNSAFQVQYCMCGLTSGIFHKVGYYFCLIRISTVVPAKSDSDVIFCLQLLSKTLTCTLYLS